MYNISLNDNELDFKTLEKKIYKIVCDVACDTLKRVLERLDSVLMAKRDLQKYRNKGIRKTRIHTIMGTVEYERRIYETQDEDGKKQYIYLLDQYLKNETIGYVSTNLAEKMVERVLEESYRKSAQAIESMTNENLSHTTVWNVVHKIGDKLEKQDQEKMARYEKGKLNGDREVKVLFQEADGIWLSMQGKDRPKRGKSKKKELKVAINYEGWKKRKGQKEGYVVHNKTACAGFYDSKTFKKLWDATVAEKYNTDEIETRIINGDGDPWIKSSLGEEGVHFQLDPFHISKAIVRDVSDKKQANKLKKLFRKGRVDEGFEYLRELLIEYNEDEDKFKKLEQLYNYLDRNREGLMPYRLRDIKLPELEEGLEYRTLGTMEHNICDIIALRMSGRKMSWSIKGASYLAKLLAARASGNLYERLDGLFDGAISEDKLDEMVEIVQLSAAQVNKKPKTSKIYKISRFSMPFEGQPLTEGMKAIRNLVENRVASDLVYR
jgi:hypothetical protein